MMKNIPFSQVLTLREQIAYQPGQVVSRTLVQNESVSVTLFSFDKDEEIITIDGVEYELHQGESIVMPARHPHAVYGKEQFKMLLVVIF